MKPIVILFIIKYYLKFNDPTLTDKYGINYKFNI